MLKAIEELVKKLAGHLRTNEECIDIVLYDSTASIQLTVKEFYHQYNPEEIQKGHCNIVIKIDVMGEAVAAVMLKDMVGCAGILLAHDLYVLPDFRNKKVGSTVMDFIQAFAKHYGYGMLQATDKEDNLYTGRMFVSRSWTKTSTFVNPKTKNNICLWNLKLS